MCTLDGCGSETHLPPIQLSETDRRAFLAGAASLPLATVLAFPELAAAQAARLEPVQVATQSGRRALGVVAMPEKLPAPAVILIHEWWGLNDQIKSVAADLANQGFISLAVDLYDGKVAANPDEARALINGLDADRATDALVSMVNYLKTHETSNGKVATLGWCFGGGWSLNAAIAAPVDAAVIYYGRVDKSAAELANLETPLLGHFGTEDRSINPQMVGGFKREMAKAGKADLLSVHWYTANHAFANPTGARYDEDDAQLAWARTLAFFHQNLSA